MTTYLLQLELADGYGMHSDYKYYVINCSTYPVNQKLGNLDLETLESLRKKYPQDQKIHNSAYHRWSVISLGSESMVNSIYNVYQETVKNKTMLRQLGFEI